MLGSVGHVRVLRALASDRVPQSAPQLAAAAGLTPQGTDALMSSIRDVLDRHGAVSAAWLYGSVARGEDAPESDVDIALVVRSQAVADQVREALMPLEDAQQIRISLTALTARDLAALPDDDPWWVNVVREGRVLKGAAPDQARRRLARAAA